VDPREELAAIAAEHAALQAELELFAQEYDRRVGRLVAELHALDPRLPGRRSRRRRRARRAAREERAAAPAKADLKRAFREAAKRMHPDLATNPDHRNHAEAFMKRLNDSYRAGDAHAIEDLIAQWDASPYGRKAGDDARPPVVGVHAAVERARRQLEALRASELAELMEETMAAAAEGRDHLAEMRADAEAALAAARARART
jgi:hypothetical protein